MAFAQAVISGAAVVLMRAVYVTLRQRHLKKHPPPSQEDWVKDMYFRNPALRRLRGCRKQGAIDPIQGNPALRIEQGDDDAPRLLEDRRGRDF